MRKNMTLRNQINQLKNQSGVQLPTEVLRAVSEQLPLYIKVQNKLDIMVLLGPYPTEILERTPEQWFELLSRQSFHRNLIKLLVNEYKAKDRFSLHVLSWIIDNPMWNGVPEKTLEETQQEIANFFANNK